MCINSLSKKFKLLKSNNKQTLVVSSLSFSSCFTAVSSFFLPKDGVLDTGFSGWLRDSNFWEISFTLLSTLEWSEIKHNYFQLQFLAYNFLAIPGNKFWFSNLPFHSTILETPTSHMKYTATQRECFKCQGKWSMRRVQKHRMTLKCNIVLL